MTLSAKGERMMMSRFFKRVARWVRERLNAWPSPAELGLSSEFHLSDNDRINRAQWGNQRVNYPEQQDEWYSRAFRDIEGMRKDEVRLDREHQEYLQMLEAEERERARQARAEALAQLEGSTQVPAPQTTPSGPVQRDSESDGAWKAWHLK
ncbi:hypothetical protein NPX13_g3594 [Xylaria arbuscula]|uniref:Uncharacterized protein n=1 Tax=Xylaria arbuscula TaxID=114810 RepID=A0A9W8NI71_9PEZI|nr:hypothetical protein NPX13_g3594 [Xylaria arbuscula]